MDQLADRLEVRGEGNGGIADDSQASGFRSHMMAMQLL